jgi:hypothetical protein
MNERTPLVSRFLIKGSLQAVAVSSTDTLPMVHLIWDRRGQVEEADGCPQHRTAKLTTNKAPDKALWPQRGLPPQATSGAQRLGVENGAAEGPGLGHTSSPRPSMATPAAGPRFLTLSRLPPPPPKGRRLPSGSSCEGLVVALAAMATPEVAWVHGRWNGDFKRARFRSSRSRASSANHRPSSRWGRRACAALRRVVRSAFFRPGGRIGGRPWWPASFREQW